MNFLTFHVELIVAVFSILPMVTRSTDISSYFNLPINLLTEKVLKTERCNEYFIPMDLKGLEQDIKDTIYGQPFLQKALMPVLKAHLNGMTNKALTLSFHGSPGVGKNFLAGIIAKNVFLKGLKSQFVRYYSGTIDFTNGDRLVAYKDKLEKDIVSTMKNCESSLFIFDEVEKMPSGMLDVIKTYVDYNIYADGVHFRKAIFIFLSNLGMKHINDKSVELYKEGLPRDKFKLKDFQQLFMHVFNEKGGLKKSDLIVYHLVDLFIPFLPLERENIIQCISEENRKFKKKFRNEDDISKILEWIDFVPEDIKAFARHGCKNLTPLVAMYLDNDRDEL